MKKPILLILLFNFSILMSCEAYDDIHNNNDNVETITEWECGTHNGNTLYTGPRGGCYYYNSSGNKIYVDRSECDC